MGQQHASTPASCDEGEHGLARRPVGVDDDVVAAVGKLSEALEWIERARGRLYDFHQMCGHADVLFEEAADQFAAAGAAEAAERIRHDVIGRNVLDGRWTFQVIEEFDDTYWAPVRALDAQIRHEHVAGRRHVYEAELKRARITPGHPHHQPVPPPRSPDDSCVPRG